MREYTNKLMGLVQDGMFDHGDGMYDLVSQLLMWLSEADVKEFWYANGFEDLYGEQEED